MNRALAAPRSHLIIADIAELVGGSADTERLRDGLRRLTEDLGLFRHWLAELREDRAAVQDVVRRSYWHPNGFAKIVLCTSDDPEFRIRLHVWPRSAGERLGESNPHSHRWDFASTVLAGDGLITSQFAESEDSGGSYDRYRYGTDPGNKAGLAVDGRVRLTEHEMPVIARGRLYTCDTSVIHTVRPAGSRLTATLVVQGPQKSMSTVVYREPGASAEQPNRAMTEASFLQLSGDVLSEIADREDARR
jgi:hypothetical protein